MPFTFARVAASKTAFFFTVLAGPLAAEKKQPGPVPYTLIVAPGGKILYRHVGAFDLAEIRAKLVDVLGPYYNPATNN